MESKHLTTAITIGCLAICTWIVSEAAINRHNAAIHSGSNSDSGMGQSYDQQFDPSTLSSGSGSNRQGFWSGAMLFPAGSEATIPTPAPQILTVGPATTPPSPNDPLADYVLSGFVTVDGEAEAVLEQRSTKQSWYLKAGDLWQNYRVVSVGPGQIVLAVDGQQRALAMNDSFNAVPLSADAPYLKARELRSRRRIFTLAAEDSLNTLSWEDSSIQPIDIATGFQVADELDTGIQVADGSDPTELYTTELTLEFNSLATDARVEELKARLDSEISAAEAANTSLGDVQIIDDTVKWQLLRVPAPDNMIEADEELDYF